MNQRRIYTRIFSADVVSDQTLGEIGKRV